MIEGLAKGLLRCAYCHGEAYGLLEGCCECAILLHADCRRALGRCPTIGCQTLSVQSVGIQIGPGEPAEDSPQPLQALAARLSGSLQRAGAVIGAYFLPLAVGSALLVGGSVVVVALVPFRVHEQGASPETKQRAVAKGIQDASKHYKINLGRWPATIDDLFASTDPRWRGPYLDDLPLDSSGAPYRIEWRGHEAWLALELEGADEEGSTIQFLQRLFTRAPAATCGVPPTGAHVRAHQLTR